MKKFFIGCAISVGVLLLLGIGGSFFLVQRLKNSFPDMDRLKVVEQELVQRDGVFDSEIMPLDGSIPAEMLDDYRHFRGALSQRVEASARPLQGLIDEGTEGRGGFAKLRTMVSGGLDVARASVVIAGVADSLMLDSGLSRGQNVYLMTLVRYGATDFEPPLYEDEYDDVDAGREKIMEVIEEFEDELRRRAFKLFENQRQELRGLEALDEHQAAWLASLDSLLEERPRSLANLRGLLQPWQLEALEPHLAELRETWPDLPAEYFLDLLPAMDDAEGEDGVRIDFG